MMAADINLHHGDLAKAKAGYEHILTAHPRFAPAANNLAWVLMQTGGDKERVLQLAQIAKEGAPDDPFVSDTLGWILHQRGVNERAFGLLKDSAAKLPRNGEVQYHAGVVARALGQIEVAREYLERAAAADNEFPGKSDARKVLAELR